MRTPETRRLRALLFDFDHTLADLGRWVDWRGARAAIADLYTRAGTDAEGILARRGAFSLITSLHEAQVVATSREHAEAVRVEAYAILETHERAGAERTALLPGAREALAGAAAAGLEVGIVSANAETAIRRALDRAGVAMRVAAVVGRTPSLPLKPAPDMYQEVLRRLGCPAAAALAVGDSPNDMRAAAAAGILTVGVTGGEGNPDQLFESGACFVLADLTALPTLLALWSAAAE